MLSERSPQKSSRESTTGPRPPVRLSLLLLGFLWHQGGGAPRMTKIGFPIHLSQARFNLTFSNVILVTQVCGMHIIVFNLKDNITEEGVCHLPLPIASDPSTQQWAEQSSRSSPHLGCKLGGESWDQGYHQDLCKTEWLEGQRNYKPNTSRALEDPSPVARWHSWPRFWGIKYA